MTVIEVQRHYLLVYFLYSAGKFQCTDSNVHLTLTDKVYTYFDVHCV